MKSHRVINTTHNTKRVKRRRSTNLGRDGDVVLEQDWRSWPGRGLLLVGRLERVPYAAKKQDNQVQNDARRCTLSWFYMAESIPGPQDHTHRTNPKEW